MIIGVSGHMNSGKDLVGLIIQHLTDSNWKIKKFADKLKDIVCLLIGCTREQLEDRKFKETPLSSEWDKQEKSNIETIILNKLFIMIQLTDKDIKIFDEFVIFGSFSHKI